MLFYFCILAYANWRKSRISAVQGRRGVCTQIVDAPATEDASVLDIFVMETMTAEICLMRRRTSVVGHHVVLLISD